MGVILPIFSAVEESAYCNSGCEYSLMHTVCVCKQCGGLNHGRTAYFERLERSKPENVFRTKIVEFLDSIDNWDRDSEDYKAGKLIAGMMIKPDLIDKVPTLAEWCQIGLPDAQKFLEQMQANGVLEDGNFSMSVDMEKVIVGEPEEYHLFRVEFVLMTLAARNIVRCSRAEAA